MKKPNTVNDATSGASKEAQFFAVETDGRDGVRAELKCE